MSIPFRRPSPRHRVVVATEKAAITRHFTIRQVPVSTPGQLLLASWNVANLGVQGRSDAALDVVAHIMKRFDLLAVKEINEEFRVFEKVVRKIGSKFDHILTDTAGNDERLAYVYDKIKFNHAISLANSR